MGKNGKKSPKNKLLLRRKEVLDCYLKNGANGLKTARELKVNKDTLYQFLKTDEAKEEIKRRDEETAMLSQNAQRLMLTEGLKRFLTAKKNMTQKDWAYFLANITGSTSDVRIAKIRAGVGVQQDNRLDTPLSPEDLAHHKVITKDAQK